MTITPSATSLQRALEGILLGTAVSDALGLPAEGLSRERLRRRWRGEWRMRFCFGYGMVSDDTEHTFMVAQALLAHPDNAAAFQRTLGWKLRWWFLGLPAGVGLATAKACLKLWLGFPVNRSGVVSGGSGPAMRSAVIGGYFAYDTEKRREYVRASASLTHRSWQAETTALAVAEVTAAIVRTNGSVSSTEVFELLRQLSEQPEWQSLLQQMKWSLTENLSVPDYASRLGLEKGVTGYALHVVPVALYAWFRHPRDFRLALTQALGCGGDTDTVGAVLGALCGAGAGKSGIPADWLDHIVEWPRSMQLMSQLATQLAKSKTTRQSIPVRYFWPGILLRNLLFLIVVLVHGIRRLLPLF